MNRIETLRGETIELTVEDLSKIQLSLLSRATVEIRMIETLTGDSNTKLHEQYTESLALTKDLYHRLTGHEMDK